MSFLTNLRLAGITKGMTGTPYSDIPQGPDPLMEIINQYQNLLAQQPQIGNVANSMVAPSSTLEPPLKFGGVTGQSNPGADILARSRQSANNTYENYSKPQITAGQILAQSGIKPNEQFPTQTPGYEDEQLNRDLARRYKESQIKENENQATVAQQNADAKGWTTAIITDPHDPKKQISVRTNTITGEVQPIKLNEQNVGPISKPGANKGSLVQPKNLDVIRQSAQETLNQLDEIIDEKGNFSFQGGSAVGGSSIFNNVPFSPNWAGRNSVLRLKSLLVKDLIGEMKNQSRTGATGYGALNLGELNLLKQGADKLDTLTDEETFRTEANRIREKLNKILQDEPETNQMKPVSSHTSDGRIRVKNKITGQIGTVSGGAFNPEIYERVQ